jgi:hypothetical protein
MDFIEGLPTSSGYNCILVVVDKFSKYSHFVKLKHPFSALTVAQQYMEHIYKLHGMPTTIVSDRDKVFTSPMEGTIQTHWYSIVHEFSLPPTK